MAGGYSMDTAVVGPDADLRDAR